jgi:hypothetical protein
VPVQKDGLTRFDPPQPRRRGEAAIDPAARRRRRTGPVYGQRFDRLPLVADQPGHLLEG